MAENVFITVGFASVWLVIRLIACFRVYDDAKARGMKAGRWSLGTAIVLFPTLLFYVIVRKEKVKSVCQNCGKVGYNNWRFCPDCSSPIEKRNGLRIEKTEKAIFVFSVVLCVAVSVLMVVFGMDVLKEEPVATTELTKEDVQQLQPEVYSWIEECDKDEENDVFILDSDHSLGIIVYTRGWIECGDYLGYETEATAEKTTVKILLPEEKSINENAYNITYFDTVHSDASVCAEDFYVYSGEEPIEVKTTEIDADFDVFADWYYDSDYMTEKTFVQEINGSVQ